MITNGNLSIAGNISSGSCTITSTPYYGYTYPSYGYSYVYPHTVWDIKIKTASNGFIVEYKNKELVFTDTKSLSEWMKIELNSK